MRDTTREFFTTTSTDHRMLDKPVRDGYVFTWRSPHAIQTGRAPLAIPFHPSSNFVDASTHDKHNSRKWHWIEYNGSPAVFTKTCVIPWTHLRCLSPADFPPAQDPDLSMARCWECRRR